MTEKRMFGGLAFLVEGHLAVAALSDGLMLQVDPERTPALLGRPGAEPMTMRGRAVEGWLQVTGLLDDAALRGWVQEALDRVEQLD